MQEPSLRGQEGRPRHVRAHLGSPGEWARVSSMCARMPSLRGRGLHTCGFGSSIGTKGSKQWGSHPRQFHRRPDPGAAGATGSMAERAAGPAGSTLPSSPGAPAAPPGSVFGTE